MLETLQALLLLTQLSGTATHSCHACVFGVEVFVMFGFDVFVTTSITRTCVFFLFGFDAFVITRTCVFQFGFDVFVITRTCVFQFGFDVFVINRAFFYSWV